MSRIPCLTAEDLSDEQRHLAEKLAASRADGSWDLAPFGCAIQEYRKNKAPLHVPPRAGVSPHRAPSSYPRQRRASAGGRQPGRSHARRAPRRRHAQTRNNADWCRRLRERRLVQTAWGSADQAKLAALVPLPRVHLVRYAGCLAPHSKLREALIPTPRQQGVDEEEAQPGTPSWSWARLLGRVFALDMATCLPPLCGRREPCDLPFCRQGALRMIAAITQAEVIRKMLRHLQLVADPPPIAPARARQATFDWVA